MYAVIKTGGKQYKVAKDDILIIEKLPGDAGSVVQFDQVLMVGGAGKSAVGAPLVAGAVVTATVLEQQKGDKILVRKNYRRKKGHRQFETVVRIAGIYTDGAKPDLTAAAPAKKPAAKKAPAKKAAAKAKKAE
jgi:large subunit ribosomal protein L21